MVQGIVDGRRGIEILDEFGVFDVYTSVSDGNYGLRSGVPSPGYRFMVNYTISARAGLGFSSEFAKPILISTPFQ